MRSMGKMRAAFPQAAGAAAVVMVGRRGVGTLLMAPKRASSGRHEAVMPALRATLRRQLQLQPRGRGCASASTKGLPAPPPTAAELEAAAGDEAWRERMLLIPAILGGAVVGWTIGKMWNNYR
jgi:hypothetical protein